MTTAAWCAVCRRAREPLTEVLVVTDRATGAVRCVCRPRLAGGDCFRLGVRSVERDAIADPADQPRPAAPATDRVQRSTR